MSISSFQLLRYRAFRDEQRVDLRPITLVLGRNNVGKSALLRAPHFLTLPLSTRAAEVPFPLSEDGFGTH